MDRRAFLSIVTGGGLLAAPLAAEAQTAGKVYRIGYLLEGPPGQTSPQREGPRRDSPRDRLPGGTEHHPRGALARPKPMDSPETCRRARRPQDLTLLSPGG